MLSGQHKQAKMDGRPEPSGFDELGLDHAQLLLAHRQARRARVLRGGGEERRGEGGRGGGGKGRGEEGKEG